MPTIVTGRTASPALRAFIATHGGDVGVALRADQLGDLIRSGADVTGLIRAVWDEVPVVRDEPFDLRELDQLEDASFRALAADALEHHFVYPADALAAKVVHLASYQAPDLFVNRIAAWAAALSHPEVAETYPNPLTLEDCNEEQLRPLLEICAASATAFVLLRGTPCAPAIEEALGLRFGDHSDEDLDYEIWYDCLAAGLDPEDRARRLYPALGFHLAPDAVASDGLRVRCGGEHARTCPHCRRPVLHLLTLDPVPPALGVTRLPRLSLACCPDCIGLLQVTGWHCRHDEAGEIQPQGGRASKLRRSRIPHPGRALGFPATSVRLVPTPARWQTQRVDSEFASRIGGPPAWVQHGTYPECPGCERNMTLLAQLAEDSPDGGLWRDRLYIHWCEACRISHYDTQNT